MIHSAVNYEQKMYFIGLNFPEICICHRALFFFQLILEHSVSVSFYTSWLSDFLKLFKFFFLFIMHFIDILPIHKYKIPKKCDVYLCILGMSPLERERANKTFNFCIFSDGGCQEFGPRHFQ